MGPAFASFVTVLGVLLGIAFALFGPPDLSRTTAPRSLLRADAFIFVALAVIGLATGALGWVITDLSGSTISARLGAALIGVLVGVFAGGQLLRSSNDILRAPLTASMGSIAAAAVGAVVLGSIGYLVGGLSHHPMIDGSLSALGGSAAFALFFGLVGGFAETASAWYWLTTCWFWIRGRLPRRLMPFLEDAHRRGVLRQVGAVYQFRHSTLQERLLQRDGDMASDGGPPSASHPAAAASPAGAS
jgi:hypothetical protein